MNNTTFSDYKTCPSCGQPIHTTCITAIPPKYQMRCFSCGWVSKIYNSMSEADSDIWYDTDSTTTPKSDNSKIIKPGKDEFEGHCSRCGCHFRYTLDELKISPSNYVSCPYCGADYYHPDQSKSYDSSNFLNTQPYIDPYTGQYVKTTDLPRIYKDYQGDKGRSTYSIDYAPNRITSTTKTFDIFDDKNQISMFDDNGEIK